jgi:hypothetical protein
LKKISLFGLLLLTAGVVTADCCFNIAQDYPSQNPYTSITFQPSLSSVSPVTISWSTNNSSSCVASGSWQGTLAASGSTTITDVTATSSYTLTCGNQSLTCAPLYKTICYNTNDAVKPSPPVLTVN